MFVCFATESVISNFLVMRMREQGAARLYSESRPYLRELFFCRTFFIPIILFVNFAAFHHLP